MAAMEAMVGMIWTTAANDTTAERASATCLIILMASADITVSFTVVSFYLWSLWENSIILCLLYNIVVFITTEQYGLQCFLL